MANKDDTNWEILAGLRFVLAWIVICGHVSFYFADTNPIIRAIGDLGGKAAVVGFLLVSGYSIAASIGARRDGFYRRRLLRIYPLYITAILFAYAVELAFSGIATMPSHEAVVGTGPWVMLANAVFAQTFVVKPMAFDGPIWSLAIEVSYYIAAPLLVRLDKRLLLGLLAVSALAYAAPRRDDLGALYFLFSRLNALIYAWAWLMGFALYGMRHTWLLGAFAIGGTVLVASNSFNNPEAAAPMTFLVAFGCAALAATVGRRWTLPRQVGRALTYLGDLSYPLYLIHFPALIAAVGLGLTGSWSAMMLATVLSVASLSLIEVRFKRYFVARFGQWRQRAVTTPTAPHLT